MFVKDHPAGFDIAPHQLSWADFDSLARGAGGADVIRRLRDIQRSRRLLMLRALLDEVAGNPDLFGPFPTPDEAWDLLARAQETAPDQVDLILAHPYTGAWLAHTRRVVRKLVVEPDCPVWIHIGHFHALAAAAAIRAGMSFGARVPVRDGEAILPTLGMAMLRTAERWSTADVRGDMESVRVWSTAGEVVLPSDTSEDGPGWLGMRRLVTQEVNQRRLEVRLDDLDPYRDLHEVVPAERVAADEAAAWDGLLREAWNLMAKCLPEFADGFAEGFDSLVPRPAVPFRYLSGSTSETWGSAVVAKPSEATLLASALVHEFQHSKLHGIMHLTALHEKDVRQRIYTLWRDDPRPIGGVIHGIYAFFGMTAFWRALAKQQNRRRAWFELGYCRTGTLRTLQAVRHDPKLTAVGRRFVEGIGERLGPWLAEPIPDGIANLAEAAAADHYAGWRLRHLRPATDVVALLATAWPSRDDDEPTVQLIDKEPTPEADGDWTGARTELIRLRLDDPQRYDRDWQTVPGATAADFAYVSGDFHAAAQGYLAELESGPDNVPAWAGLGLALSNLDESSAAAHALRTYPELVRAVHREIRARTASWPTPNELAGWIAERVNDPGTEILRR